MAAGELVIKFKSDGTAQVLGDMSRMGSAIQGMGTQAQKTGGIFQSMFAANLISNYAQQGINSLLGLAGGFLKAGAAMNSFLEQTKMSFQVMLKNKEMTAAVVKDLQEFARVTPFSMKDVVEAGRMLTVYGLNYKSWLKDAGDLVSAFGGGADEMRQVISALGRISAGQMGEAAEIMRRFGINISKLPGIVANSQGQIKSTAVETLTALKTEIEKKYGGMMEEQAKTTQGVLRNIEDTWEQFAGQVTDSIVKILSGEGADLLRWLDELRESGDLSKLAESIGGGLAEIGKVLKWLTTETITFLRGWDTFWAGVSQTVNDAWIAIIRTTQIAMKTFMPEGKVGFSLTGLLTKGRKSLFQAIFGVSPEEIYKAQDEFMGGLSQASQGWWEKVRQADKKASSGGMVNYKGFKMTETLAERLQAFEKAADIQIQVTSAIRARSQDPRHQTGLAADISIPGLQFGDVKKARAVEAQLRASGLDVFNEYLQKSAGWTGPHMHVGVPGQKDLFGKGLFLPGRDPAAATDTTKDATAKKALEKMKQDQQAVRDWLERSHGERLGQFDRQEAELQQQTRKMIQRAQGDKNLILQIKEEEKAKLLQIEQEKLVWMEEIVAKVSDQNFRRVKSYQEAAMGIQVALEKEREIHESILGRAGMEGKALPEGFTRGDLSRSTIEDSERASEIRRKTEEDYFEWLLSKHKITQKQLLEIRIKGMDEEISILREKQTLSNEEETQARIEALQRKKEILIADTKNTGNELGKMISGTIEEFVQGMILGQQKAGDFFKNLWSNILSYFARQIAKPISEMLTNMLGGIGGGGQAGGGGGNIFGNLFGGLLGGGQQLSAGAYALPAGQQGPILGGGTGGGGMLGGLLGGGIGKMLGWAGLAAGIITSLFPKVDAKTTHENRNIFLPEIDKTFQAMSELFITPIKTVQTFIEEQKDGPNIHRIYTYLEKEMGTVWTKLGEMFPEITRGVQRVYDQLQNANQMVQGLEKGFIAGGPQDVEKWKGIADQFKQFAGMYSSAMQDAAKKVWPNLIALAIESGKTVDQTIQDLMAQGGTRAEQFASIYQKKLDELTGAVQSVGARLVDKLIGMTFGWQVPGSSALFAGAPGKPTSALTQKPVTATFGGLQQFTQQQGLGGMYLPQGAYENYLAGGGKDTLQDFLYGYMKPQMGYNNPAWNVPDAYVQQYLASLTTGGGAFAGRLAEGSTAQAPWQQPIMSTMMGQFPKIKNLIEKIRSTMALGTDEAAQGEATGYAQQLEQQWTQLIGTKAPQIKEQAFFAGQNVIDYFLNLLTQGNQTAIQIMGELEGTMGTFFGEKAKDAIQEAIKTSGNAFIDFWVKTVIPDFTKMGYSSFRAPWGGKLDTVFNQIFNQMSGGTDLAKSEFGGVAGQAQDLFTQILTKRVSDIKKLAFYSGKSIYEYFEQMLSGGSQTAVDVLNEFQGRFDEIFQDSKDAINNATAANKLPFTVYEMVRSLSSGATTAVLSGVYTPQIGRDMPASVLPMFGQATFNINLSIPPGASVDTIAAMLQEAVMQSTMNRTQYFTSVG